jgi:hypothetical protein
MPGFCFFCGITFLALGVRGLPWCLPFTRECGDFGTDGDSVRCSDWVASVVSLQEGLRPAGAASLSFVSPKESKQRKCDSCGAPFIQLELFLLLTPAV